MKTSSLRRHTAVTISLMLALLVVVPCLLAAAGCGGDSPQSAVQRFLSAWQALDWNAYKNVVAPGQKLTKDQEELAKQKFQQIKVKFQDIKLETKIDPKDKNKATVTLVSGKITDTADILGKQRTDTVDVAKMDANSRPVYDAVQVNGVWYVNTSL
jgi:hypothetical protein